MKLNVSKVLIYITVFLLVLFVAYIVYSAFYIPVSRSPKVICNTHLHALYICCNLYYSDHDSLPSKENWCDLLRPYLGEETENRKILDTYLCPKDKVGPCSYTMNENIPEEMEYLPEDLVLFFESGPGWNQIGGVDDVVINRHDPPGANITFTDWHIEFVEAKDIPKLKWTVEKDK